MKSAYTLSLLLPLLCTSCVSTQATKVRLIEYLSTELSSGKYASYEPFSGGTTLELNADGRFHFSYAVIDWEYECGWDEQGFITFPRHEAYGRWDVSKESINLDFDTQLEDNLPTSFRLYEINQLTILVPTNLADEFYESIREFPDSYIEESGDSTLYRVGLTKIRDNQAVDTTAANARLFQVDTSNSTTPDMEALTEAAVVSP